jgi:small subunit ribosomal protein S20
MVRRGAAFPAGFGSAGLWVLEKSGFMANTPQAEKRIRRNARRAAVNKARLSRIRTQVKKVELAIAAGDKPAAQAALQAAQPELMRGVSKGVVHKNTASRKISRLTKRVAALG